MVEHRHPKEIQRYTAGERSNHWLIALTFILLALSGLAIFHPAFSWLYALLGGGPWTRILHPFIGVVMFACFCVFASHMWRHNRMSKDDYQWLRQFDDVVHNREAKLPEVGKYNGGQKLLFFVLVICMVGLILSGLIMWRAYFSMYFPMWAVRAASLSHAFFALVMICAIIVHIYAAIWVKGSIRAMVRGTVSWGWAWKHHRAWFRAVRKESSGD